MSLGIALKNRSAVVIAADQSHAQLSDNQLLTLPNRTVVMVTGTSNIVNKALTDIAFPKVDQQASTAAVAQYVHAALVLEAVPKLAQVLGRVEVVVAGIDPIRHVTEPNIYYLDSARDFYLTIAGTAVSTGATAAVQEVLRGRQLETSTNDQLVELTKEVYAATKLRWPGAVASTVKLGVITADTLTMLDF